MEISLESFPVEYNDGETVANQSEGSNKRLRNVFFFFK